MRKLPPVKTLFKYFPFVGGLDLVTPPIETQNGSLQTCTNLEIGINGGYSRLSGYERYDGRSKPSNAVYYTLNATITGSYATGNTLTGNTSGATAVICTTGTSGYFVLTKLVGTFQNGESLKVGGIAIATSTSTVQAGGAPTAKLGATYTNLAATQYRGDIQKVPGSGSILGVWIYNGKQYAFRNNAGGTAAALYVSSTSGWTLVSLGRELRFTTGTAVIAEGTTITGATSGATAVLKRVALNSGAYGSGNAAGSFIFASVTGAFQNGENLQVGGATKAVAGGVDTAITLLPNGRYEFQNFNFGGQLGTKRMYGVDGKNRAFEFDGTVFVPITSGMTADTPTHLRIHKNQLFLSFAGSAQFSGIGTPYAFTIISGAGEIAIGDNIVGFLTLPGGTATGALAIYARNSTFVLYGSSSADWNLVPYDPEAGGIEWTPQYITQGVCLDDKGLITLSSTQAFGNFQSGVVSNQIKPYLNTNRIAQVTGSCIVRAKNQYRLFFSSGEAVYMTFGGSTGNALTGQKTGLLGMTTEVLADAVVCICSNEGASGAEEIYFGTSSGYVMQMDVGTSFDGAAISWNGTLAFNHFGGPRILKTFLKSVTEVTGSSYCEFNFSYLLDYGSTEFDTAPTATEVSNLSGSAWDAATWDQFFWDGQTLIPSEADITGDASNIALQFSGSSAEYLPFTLFSEVMHYIPRRPMR